HETDTTLIDFASDRRAPTPTAAAEMAVPVRAELRAQVAELGARLTRGDLRLRQAAAERLDALASRLPRPAALLGLPRQRVDDLGERLGVALVNRAAQQRGRLDAVAGRLAPRLLRDGLARERARLARPEAQPSAALLRARVAREGDRLTATWRMLVTLSPEATLARGYALVLDNEGRLVRAVAAARAAGRLRVRLADGEVAAVVDGPGGRRRGGAAGTEQGDLF
ncbi:MAG: exodeoxyribonuclease VII large subunit, partial [Thermaurantiacus sp.]